MGWECRDAGVTVSLRLDSHGGEREREDERLADELAQRLRDVTLAVLREEKYRQILLFDPEWYVE